jgi:hypothetical protein
MKALGATALAAQGFMGFAQAADVPRQPQSLRRLQR